LTTPAVAESPKTFIDIDVKDAAKHIGESVSITAKVYSYKELANMTLVNLGAEYPNQLLTIVLKGTANGLVKDLNGKILTAKGKLGLYKGKPEILATDNTQIHIEPIVGKSGGKGG
jgi:hypothetical protein